MLSVSVQALIVKHFAQLFKRFSTSRLKFITILLIFYWCCVEETFYFSMVYFALAKELKQITIVSIVSKSDDDGFPGIVTERKKQNN